MQRARAGAGTERGKRAASKVASGCAGRGRVFHRLAGAAIVHGRHMRGPKAEGLPCRAVR